MIPSALAQGLIFGVSVNMLLLLAMNVVPIIAVHVKLTSKIGGMINWVSARRVVPLLFFMNLNRSSSKWERW